MRKVAIGFCTTLLLCLSLSGLAFAGQVLQISGAQNGVTVLDQGSDGLTLQLDVGNVTFSDVTTKGGDFTLLSATNLIRSWEVGEPNLPVSNKLIVIPDGCELKASVLYSEYEDFKLSDYGLTNLIMPAQPPLEKSVDPMDVPFEHNQALYEQAGFYERPMVEAEFLGVMRDVRLGMVHIRPFHYNPTENTLRVYKNVQVNVTFEHPNWAKTYADMEQHYSPMFTSIFNRTLNYESLASGVKADLTKYPIKYVIIADRQFEAQLVPFIEWKTKKGFHVETYYLDDIGSTNTVVRDFLEGLYNAGTTADPAPSFVLFVADDNQLQAFAGSAGSHITDLRFCEFTGDDFPEIYYGRFSAQTPAQLQPQIDKTLEYEQYQMPDPSYLERVTLVSGSDGTYAITHGNGQINYGTNLYFNEAHGINANVWLYPETGSGGTVAADIIQSVSDGISFYNYTAHCGHDGTGTPSFTTSDIPGLTNYHQYLLGVGNCCLSNTFGDDYSTPCFGEAFLQVEDKGGIGYIGATNNTMWDPDYYWGVGAGDVVSEGPPYEETTLGAYDGIFHDHGEPLADHYVTNGAMIFAGNLGVTEGGSSVQYYWEVYHLMGDPSVMTYMGVPAVNPVSHIAALMMTAPSIDVTCDPYSLVAISVDGVLKGSAFADSKGTVTVPLEAFDQPCTADIVVTAQFRQPYISTIQVIAPSGPYVVLDSYTIDDAAGNNNGMVDFGESIVLGMQLKNVGPDDALDVNATIATADGYVTITDDTEAYGTIAGDFGLSNIADAFAFDVLPSVPDGHVVTFTLTVTGTARDTWEGTFTIPVHAPEIGYVSVSIDDALGGDGNGILDPGETADIIVTVENSGSGDAFGVEAYLSESDSYVTIDDDYGLFGDIAASASTSNAGNVYTATADAGCPMGHAVSVDLALSTTGGYTTTLNFSLTVGDRVVFYFDDFSADLGWTGLGGGAEWQIGECIGGGTTGRLDPTEDHTSSSDNRVLGNDLTSAGLYSSGLSETFWIYSPVIDCAEMTGVEMRYWHWLGCESSTYDHAHFEVFDGENWVNLFSNSATNQETAWAEEFYDMSAIADNNPGFQMRWGLGSTDGSGEYSGWNIDDIELKGYSGSGSASMSFAPAVLVDSLQPGESGEQSIRVYNTGDGSLGVWFSTNDAWLDFAYDKVTVPAGDSVDVVVTIQTTGLLGGDHVGAMNFTSNDNSNASGSVPVQLHVYSPKMEIAETSIEQRVSPEETATYELVVTNSGPGNLLYSVGCQMDMKANGVAAVQETATPIGYRATDPDKGGQQEPFYDTQTKGSGGPDAYGYTWIDSDEAGGPVFGWIDISTLGTEITLSDDNYAPSYGSPLAIGFDFPFYDSLYSALYIGSNGFISFDSGYGRASGGPLPDDNFKSYIGVWHDDIDPPEVPGHVYYYHDAANGRFIVSYDHVRNYVSPAGTGDLSFQILLYANGQITFQYDTMDPGSDTEGLNSATIGIQNSAANDALQVLYNAAYMHDQLAINIGAASWLSAEPASGTVEPYGTRTVHVNFDAAGMELGDYTGSVVFNCNDGDTPTMSLPVTMTISAGCCSGPSVGNVDGSVDELVTMNDLTVLIDHLFISMDPLVCPAEGNTDLSADELVTMSDLTVLIDHLFISLDPLPPCP